MCVVHIRMNLNRKESDLALRTTEIESKLDRVPTPFVRTSQSSRLVFGLRVSTKFAFSPAPSGSPFCVFIITVRPFAPFFSPSATNFEKK